MNNERYNQIIDEVYSSYLQYKRENITSTRWDILFSAKYRNSDKPLKPGDMLAHATGRMCTKEELIEKIKLNKDWSERWGLKIEERELSVQERNEWFQINRNGNNPLMKSDWKDFELDQQNIPKRVITLTYKNETIEVYE
jgi:hypothetical protein